MTHRDHRGRLTRATAVLRESNDLGDRLAEVSGHWLCELRSRLTQAIDLVGDLARTDDGELRVLADAPPSDEPDRIDEVSAIVLWELSRRLYAVEHQIRRLGGPAVDLGDDEDLPAQELSREEVARDYPGNHPLACLTISGFASGGSTRGLRFCRLPWSGDTLPRPQLHPRLLVAVDPRCIAWGSLIEGTHVTDCRCRLWTPARSHSAAHCFGWPVLSRDGVLLDLIPGGFEVGRLRGPGPVLAIQDSATGRERDVASYVLERPGQLPVRVIAGPESSSLFSTLSGRMVQVVRRGDRVEDGRPTRMYSAGLAPHA